MDVENGIETVCDFPIIISKSAMDSSGSRMEFVATSNPYEGREENYQVVEARALRAGRAFGAPLRMDVGQHYIIPYEVNIL